MPDEEAARPFPLADGPLVRALLITVDDRDRVFVLAIHHAVTDNWSYGALLGELAVAYDAFAVVRTDLGGDPSFRELTVRCGKECLRRRPTMPSRCSR
ncbi:condensation domain-containing protein [Micromonospora sp. CA-246542]|uniref:condensation domain-containing protein n=1 Tax=Micromonospora sp. CA-246542 TaxID=3239959 RepID=UPI003D8FA22A